MAVKIRLQRGGKKNKPVYRIVVADARSPRDGKYIEKLGNFNPNTDPSQVTLDADSALKWVLDGAQPTDTVRKILSEEGVMLRKHLQIGVNKGAITQEVADERFAVWSSTKENKNLSDAEKLAKAKADALKAKFDAEAKVNQDRIDAIQKRKDEAAAALAAEIAEANKKEEETTEEAEENSEEPAAE